MDEGDPNEVIDRTILESRKERSKKTIVEGRGVEKGDLCIVSFEARRLADDELLPGSRHERMGLDTTNPNHIPMEGAKPAAVCHTRPPHIVILIQSLTLRG